MSEIAHFLFQLAHGKDVILGGKFSLLVLKG